MVLCNGVVVVSLGKRHTIGITLATQRLPRNTKQRLKSLLVQALELDLLKVCNLERMSAFACLGFALFAQ